MQDAGICLRNELSRSNSMQRVGHSSVWAVTFSFKHVARDCSNLFQERVGKLDLRYGKCQLWSSVTDCLGRYCLKRMSDSKHRKSVPPTKPQGSTPQSSPAASGRAGSPLPASSPVPQNDKTGEDKSGRVAFDSKGNPVWEWQTAPGVFEQDVTTQRLKKLEAPELSLASTQPVPTLGGNSAKNAKTKSKEDTGFNPYDSDAALKPRTNRTNAAHPALVHKRQPPPRRSTQEPPKEETVWDKLKSKFT